MATKDLKLSVDIDTNKYDKKIEEIKSSFGKFMKVEEAMIAHFNGHAQTAIRSIGKMAVPLAEVEARIKALDKLNLKAFPNVEKLNEERMKGIVAEIEGETKKAKTIEKTNELYKKKEQLILEQSETAKKKLEKEYAMLIEASDKSKTTIEAIENAKKENLVLIDKKLKEDLKKNNEEHYTAQKAFADKSLKETTELLTKTIYHSKNELDKDSQEKVKRAEKELEDLLAIEDRRYSGLLIGASNNAESISKVDAEHKGRMEALKLVHTAKIAKINEEAAKKAKGTATEAAKATTEKTQEAAQKTEDAAKKAEGAWTRIINVGAMSKNIDEGVKNLKHYDEQLTLSMGSIIAYFEEQEKLYWNDSAKFKELQEVKKAVLAKYTAEKIKVEEMITTAEQTQHDLRWNQIKQYAERTKELTKELSGAMTKTSEYLSTGLGAVSDIYKAEMASIDEDIKHLKAKNAEAIEIATSHSTHLQNLNKAKVQAEADNNEEQVKIIDEKIKKENELYAEAEKTKLALDIKEEELKRKKAKKQAEQEKIEKLKRKADMIKSIGEGIFNIAQGVTKAFSYGPILGPILAAVVATAGAVQVGIMTKQLAKFEDGGLLNGKRHTQGGMRIEGTNIEVEGGEYVVNRESTSKNLGLVRYINSQRKELSPTDINAYFSKSSQGFEMPFSRKFESGGQMPVVNTVSSVDNEALVDAIKSIRIAPKVAVTDIIRAQDEAVEIDGWSGM